MDRYKKNGIFSSHDMQLLKEAKVCVIGCGGLGGYILEMLARAGVGDITMVDGDVFDETNLNRQILSKLDNLGKIKVFEAKKRVEGINSEVNISAVHAFLNATNIHDVISSHDVVLDALDHIPTRFLLKDWCEKLDTPMVYGAIAGWFGQVATILPGDKTLEYIYPNYLEKNISKGIEENLGNPSFTPALIASIQVSECLKLITKKGELLRHKMLHIDLLDCEMTLVPIMT